MFTDAGSTPVASDGDLIYQINDKSGNSKNATQATEANRPAYKTNIQNSLSMGLGDGSNDVLEYTDVPISGDLYFLFILKIPNPIPDWKGWSCNLPGNNRNYIQTMSAGSIGWLSGTDNWKQAGINGSVSAGTVHLLEVWRDSSDVLYVYSNGADKSNSQTDDGSDMTIGAIFVGGANYWAGHVGEFLAYSCLPSEEDRATLRAWANAKWSVY
jgi:hypothetical protein